MRVLVRLLATAAALWVATRVVPGITHTGSLPALLGVALVFGVVNTVVGPVLKLLSLPVLVLSLGLFALVINALLLQLTSWMAGQLALGFHVDGFLSAVIGSVLITVVSALLMVVFGPEESAKR
jgi:putative membrane protein